MELIGALQARFTDIQGPDIRDICYATQSRQSAVRDLSKLVELILVVGAANSSNSNRLREIGTEAGVARYLITDGSKLNPEWLKDARTVGVTAGASAPETSNSGFRPNWLRADPPEFQAQKETM
jgi:4-hydroxy-3-methylbut-2-enyl diphosphate reductase